MKGPHRSFDLAGATAVTGVMLLAVYTVVQAPEVGWASARTVGSLIGVAAMVLPARLRPVPEVERAA